MKRVVRANPLPGCRVKLLFDDGVEGIADLSDLAGRGVFADWLKPGEFERVNIGDSGDLVWASGVDQCADALYLRVTGRSPEDLFPALRPEHVA
jgi:hypothetical protein